MISETQRSKWIRRTQIIAILAEVFTLGTRIPFWARNLLPDILSPENTSSDSLNTIVEALFLALALCLTVLWILRSGNNKHSGANLFRSADVRAMAHRAGELATINRVAETINRTLDLQEILNVSLRGAVSAIGWDMGSIHMWDVQSNSFTMVSYEGLTEEFIRQTIVLESGDGLVGQAAAMEETLVIDDARSHPDTRSTHLPGFPVSQIYIPLISQPGQMVGVLNVSSSQHSLLKEAQADLLITVAHQIALAIDKAQLYSKVSRHAIELERIVDARTEQLEEVVDELQVALERAKEAEDLKSLLLSTVSHELRTPLATIKGNTSMIIEHHARISPAMLVEHLRDIEEETDKLTDLISNLLDMSRLEAGILHIQPHPIDLVQVVRSAVNSATIRHPQHEISFSVESPTAPCLGDGRRIEQIVANLLDNAAKYSPSGTAISVEVEKRNRDLVVSIQDHGLGIAPEQMERIFDRFYQISSTENAESHGIGLGLAICRGLVEAHGGGIWAISHPGQGSMFSFSIPMAHSEDLSEES